MRMWSVQGAEPDGSGGGGREWRRQMRGEEVEEEGSIGHSTVQRGCRSWNAVGGWWKFESVYRSIVTIRSPR